APKPGMYDTSRECHEALGGRAGSPSSGYGPCAPHPVGGRPICLGRGPSRCEPLESLPNEPGQLRLRSLLPFACAGVRRAGTPVDSGREGEQVGMAKSEEIMWVQLATRIPKALHRKLRLHCVRQETSVMEFATDAIREKLATQSSPPARGKPAPRTPRLP